MGNTFATDPTLPDTNLLLTGREITSDQFQNLAELANWNIANSGANVVWCQNWPEGMKLDAGSRGTRVTNLLYAPYVSSRHPNYSVSIWAEGDPSMILAVETSSGTTQITITTAGWYRLDVPSGADPTLGDRIALRHWTAGGSGIVYGIVVEVMPATSPLAVGDTDGEPFGLVRFAAGEPLTARDGIQLLDVAEECVSRPRVLSAWSATTHTVGKFVSYAQAAVHGGFAYRHLGREPYTYHVAALVTNNSAVNAQLIRVGGASIGPVPAGAVDTWVYGTVVVKEGSSRSRNPLTSLDVSEELLSAGWSAMFSTLGNNWELQDPLVEPSDKDVVFKSLTVWGE